MASTQEGESLGEELGQGNITGRSYGSSPDVEILYNKELDDRYDLIDPGYLDDNTGDLDTGDDVIVVFEVGGLEEGGLEVVSDALERGHGIFITKPSYYDTFLDHQPEWFNVDSHLDGYWAEVEGEKEMYFHIER